MTLRGCCFDLSQFVAEEIKAAFYQPFTGKLPV